MLAQLAQWAADHYGAGIGVSRAERGRQPRRGEDQRGLHAGASWRASWAACATNTRIGVRYEKTDVVSTSVIAIPEAIEWQANNDFRIVLSDEQQPFSEKTSYSYILPNLDFSIDFTDELKGRASFGKTIARAPYGNLYAGPGAQQPSGSVLLDPSARASGNAQNPGLMPLESDNLDLGAGVVLRRCQLCLADLLEQVGEQLHRQYRGAGDRCTA